jgi:hypothetical protein
VIQSIFLPHCWVCERRFIDSNPPGEVTKNLHHIVPKAAGGEDGPVVSICSDHHDALHKIALRMAAKKPHFDLVNQETDAQKKKLYWLATVVHNAFAATKGDPNKKVIATVELNRKQQDMVAQLMGVYPAAKSREAILTLALEALFSKHFSKK